MYNIICFFAGCVITFFTTKFFIGYKFRITMSNEIKDILIKYKSEINNIDSLNFDEANKIAFNCIKETDPLIKRYFIYIGKCRKRKKIETIYSNYKKPYELEVDEPLNAFSKEQNIKNPIKYRYADVPNSYERTKNYICKLIDTF